MPMAGINRELLSRTSNFSFTIFSVLKGEKNFLFYLLVYGRWYKNIWSCKHPKMRWVKCCGRSTTGGGCG
ncbi:unnamed protein product [Meloidogyne enterolobii]|uniref:Uncharacterized protein n=1 Tax=Meloidogyne enterolobii TaxID=390850 RepID=A0ACB1AV48_MELEN